MEFKLDRSDLARVETGAEREIARLEQLERPRSEPHREMLLYWHQTNREQGKSQGERTADKGIIEAISPKPLNVYFPKGAEDLKHRMTNIADNPFKKGFVVDVYVQYVASQPKIYTVLLLHEVIDLEDDDDAQPQTRLGDW